MNHLSEGELRAYLDHELATDHATQVQQHLAACGECADLLNTLETRSTHLTALWRDESVVVPSLTLARNRIHTRSVNEIHPKEKVVMQPKRRFQFRYAALATAAILMVALMFPPVQTWAAQVLGLFRVQQVTLLPVDFSSLGADPEERAGTLLSEMLSDNVKSEIVGEAKEVATWDEAGATSGFAVRTPAFLESAPTKIQVSQGANMEITLDAQRLRDLVSVLGREDIIIPDSLTGDVLNVQVPQGVQAMWGDCTVEAVEFEEGTSNRPGPEGRNSAPVNTGVDCTTLIQIPSPTVSTPADLDMAAMGQLYLEFLGMSKEEASNFGSTLDWSSTLVIPVPSNEADFETVTVDGVEGTLIRSQYGRYNTGGYMLIWVRDGIIYALTGSGDNAEGLAIANSMK
jgi:anti-sigma factor RsiW